MFHCKRKMKSVLKLMITVIVVHSTYHPRAPAVVGSNMWHPEASSYLPSLPLPRARALELDPRNWLPDTSGWHRRSKPCHPIHGQRYRPAKTALQMTTEQHTASAVDPEGNWASRHPGPLVHCMGDTQGQIQDNTWHRGGNRDRSLAVGSRMVGKVGHRLPARESATEVFLRADSTGPASSALDRGRSEERELGGGMAAPAGAGAR